MELPLAIVAFKLRRRANITRDERLLVFTGIDYTERDKLYEQAKTSLKIKGEQTDVDERSSGTSSSSGSKLSVKLEPAFSVIDHVEDREEVYLASGNRQHGYGSGWRGNSGHVGGFVGNRVWRGNSWHGGSGAGNGRGGISFASGHLRNKGGFGRGRWGGRPMNSLSPDGNVLLCVVCGSFRHLFWKLCGQLGYYACESSECCGGGNWEGSFIFRVSEFVRNWLWGHNCAVLDSACCSTVCGDKWPKCYLESLDEQESAEVQSEPGTKWFKVQVWGCRASEITRGLRNSSSSGWLESLYPNWCGEFWYSTSVGNGRYKEGWG